MTDQEVPITDKSIFILIYGFIIGITVSSFIFVSPLFGLLGALIGVAIIITEKIWRFSISEEALFISLALLSCSLGIIRYAVKDFHDPVEPSLLGVVISEPEYRENSTRFVMRADNGEKVLVSTDLYSSVKYGDMIKINNGSLREPGIIDDGIRRPFNYGAYLARDDIYYTLGFADLEIVSHGYGSRVKDFLIKIKNKYEEKTREIFPEPESSLLTALTIAGKSALPQEILEQFRQVGVIHVIVLSGYHITIVTVFLFWLFNLIFIHLPFGPKLARLATILGLLIFVLMVGASASIIRAAIMALIAIGAKFFNRLYNASRALLVAVLLIVVINPKILIFDTGFHLSFLATAGIIYLAPLIEYYLAKLIPATWGLRNLFAVTAAAQAFVSPYLLYSMGDISTIALIANLIILPTVSPAMLIGFISTLIAFVSDTIAIPFSFFTYLLLNWIFKAAAYFASMKFAVYAVPKIPFWIILAIYIFMIYLIKFFKGRMMEEPHKSSLPEIAGLS